MSEAGRREVRKAAVVSVIKKPASLLGAALVLATALSSCASNAPQDTMKPEGPKTRDIHSLFKPVMLVAIVIGIFVYALVLFASAKFRRRSEDDIPVQVHGNTAMEIGWTVAPAVLLAGFGFFSVKEIQNIAAEPKNAYEVAVIGHQWWWEYRYPTAGNDKLNAKIERVKNDGGAMEYQLVSSGDVVTTANELHIPAGRPVRLQIHSGDVMHNYWVPKLAGKIYAIPGRLNKLTIEADADDAGKTFYGQCAEFCGTSHANMRFKVVVDSPEDFKVWLAGQAAPSVSADEERIKAGSTKGLSETAAAGEKIFYGSGGCTACHVADNSAKTNYQVVDPDTLAIAGRIGPNLTHFGVRKHFAGATAETNSTNLRAWLRNPQEFKPGSRMVIRTLTEDEVTKLVAYLQELK